MISAGLNLSHTPFQSVAAKQWGHLTKMFYCANRIKPSMSEDVWGSFILSHSSTHLWILLRSHPQSWLCPAMTLQPGGCSLSTQSHRGRCLDRGLREDLNPRSHWVVQGFPFLWLHYPQNLQIHRNCVKFQHHFCWSSQIVLLRLKSCSFFFI